MLRTRLWVGSLLVLAAGGLLVGDQRLAPWFPCLFACLMFVGVVAARELVRLFPPVFRPSELLAVTGVLLAVAANWHPVIRAEFVPGSPVPSSAEVASRIIPLRSNKHSKTALASVAARSGIRPSARATC